MIKNLKNSLNTAEAVESVYFAQNGEIDWSDVCLNTAEAVESVYTYGQLKTTRLLRLNTAEAVESVYIINTDLLIHIMVTSLNTAEAVESVYNNKK